jgi:integrase
LTARRGNDDGSIRRRGDGRWEARITLDDGKRKSYYGTTRQEVAKLLASVLRDRDSGLPVVGGRQTLGEYLESWLQASKHSVKPRTWVRYAEYVHRHAIPKLGRVPLTRLTPQHLQALYAEKLEERLSPATVHHLHAALHRALAVALRLGLVQRNVTDMVDPPRMAHHEMTVLAPEQVRALLMVAAGRRLEALYMLAVTSGLRQGELLALRWRDVDFDAATLQVRATLQRTSAGLVFAAPRPRARDDALRCRRQPLRRYADTMRAAAQCAEGERNERQLQREHQGEDA